HVVERIEYQQGVLQCFGGDVADLVIVEQVNQRRDVVAALHGAEQLGGVFTGNEGRGGFALGNGGEERSFDISGLVNARRNAVFQQIDQERFFTGRRVLQQFYQLGDLLFGQRLRRNAFGGAFFDMFAIGF